MKRLFRAASGDPASLRELLATRLAISSATVDELLRRGAVEVDGHRMLTDGAIRIGARIVAFLSDEAVEAAPAEPLRVAYSDGQVFVVDKPAGLRSQAVRGEGWDTLIARVQRELDPAATLLHRLDRETSGLVLFPRTDHARRTLATALEEGTIERRYVARVVGRLDAPIRIALRIARDAGDARRRIALPENDPAGESAITEVTPIASSGTQSELRLRLRTGRTHQLRVHLAAVGHPIIGDTLYDGPMAERLCLHADELVFPHPRSGEPRLVTAPAPAIICLPIG